MKLLNAVVMGAAIMMPAAAHAEDINGWRLGTSGGTTLYAGDDDPTFANVSLTREFANGYVELGVSTVRGSVARGLLDAVPVDSHAISLAGGRSFGDLSVDSYVSLGKRKFDTELFQRLGQTVTINSNGSSFAIGGALTYELAVAETLFLAPFAAVDYDKVDVGRAARLPSGEVRTFKSEEEGVTGSLGASLQKLVGAHALGAHASLVATSNSSAARSGTGTGTGSRIVAALETPGQSDEWLQLGASASFALGGAWRLSMNASRSFGFTGPEATSLSAGLSVRF